jgi:trk system potassium uptake protein TrkH
MVLLALGAWSTLRGRRRVTVSGRVVPSRFIRAAGLLAASYAVLLTTGVFVLTLAERKPFLHLVFEAVSAATASGLSLGITPDLTALSKAVLITLMIAGRAGPWVLIATALPRRPSSSRAS